MTMDKETMSTIIEDTKKDKTAEGTIRTEIVAQEITEVKVKKKKRKTRKTFSRYVKGGKKKKNNSGVFQQQAAPSLPEPINKTMRERRNVNLVRANDRFKKRNDELKKKDTKSNDKLKQVVMELDDLKNEYRNRLIETNDALEQERKEQEKKHDNLVVETNNTLKQEGKKSKREQLKKKCSKSNDEFDSYFLRAFS